MPKKRGNFRFHFQGGAWDKKIQERIIHAQWFSELDKSDVMKIHVALTKKEALNFGYNDMSHHLNFHWQDRQVFKGGLVEAKLIAHSKMELIYRDNLFALSRIIEGSHLKGETLSSALKGIVGKGGAGY